MLEIEIRQCKNLSWYSKTVVNAADRGKATKHSNQRQNVCVPTGATYKGEPRMTIKIRFTQNSFTEVEMSQSLSATYKCPHTHTHTDSTWLWLCLRYIKGISSINRTFHSSFACFFPRSLRVGSCAAVNGCVCYIRIRRQKKLSLRYFVLFCFLSLANRLTRYSILPQDSASFLSQPAVSPTATATH